MSIEGSVDTSELKTLGSSKTEYSFDYPDANLLESFDNPFYSTQLNKAGVLGEILIQAPEFTSKCPKTGQPDYATIIIKYTPREKCVESKSLKLYLNGFRNYGEFHESCINRISNDLVALLDPHQLEVQGQFTPRGGISFWPRATFVRLEENNYAAPTV